MQLTDEERAAIAALKKLAKRWPKSLRLFGHAGSLIVCKGSKGPPPLSAFGETIVERIRGIHCDGGDPDSWDR